MLGRVRAAPLPVESLEMERTPSKLLNHNPLSIYEVTLMKLREGSRLPATASPPPIIHESQPESCSGGASSLRSCTEFVNTEPGLCSTISGNSQHIVASFDEETMAVDNGPCSCQSSSYLRQQASMNASVVHLFDKYRRSVLRSSFSSLASDGAVMESARKA